MSLFPDDFPAQKDRPSPRPTGPDVRGPGPDYVAPVPPEVPYPDPAIRDHLEGMLLGLAVGDALGASVEFKPPGTFAPVVGYRDGGPHRLNPGEWTDDTSMALALADSLASGWDLADQLRRYAAWYTNGEYSVNGRCFDVGLTTARAIQEFKLLGDPLKCASAHGSSSGNGSIMRLAPVPIRYLRLIRINPVLLAELGEASSITTHASDQCRSACRYFSVVLAALASGQPRDEVLSADWPVLAQLRSAAPLHPEVDEIARGSFRERQPPEICGAGYVVRTLEAALWAFHNAPDFRSAVLQVVNLGEDSDTTGAVCGQLAGAYWGTSGIPNQWAGDLARKDLINRAVAGLLGERTTH